MHYIYKLVFKETDMFYIGQTSNLDVRFDRHGLLFKKVVIIIYTCNAGIINTYRNLWVWLF